MKLRMAIAALTLAASTHAYAQRTAGDYAAFWSYWKDNCATPTRDGQPAFGCPAFEVQPTPSGSFDKHGTS
jgi:hypothetical protein